MLSHMSPQLPPIGQPCFCKYLDKSTSMFSLRTDLVWTSTSSLKMELSLIIPSSTQCQKPTVWNFRNGSMKTWQLDASTIDTPLGPPLFSSRRKMTNSGLSLITSSSTRSQRKRLIHFCSSGQSSTNSRDSGTTQSWMSKGGSTISEPPGLAKPCWPSSVKTYISCARSCPSEFLMPPLFSSRTWMPSSRHLSPLDTFSSMWMTYSSHQTPSKNSRSILPRFSLSSGTTTSPSILQSASSRELR